MCRQGVARFVAAIWPQCIRGLVAGASYTVTGRLYIDTHIRKGRLAARSVHFADGLRPFVTSADTFCALQVGWSSTKAFDKVHEAGAGSLIG